MQHLERTNKDFEYTRSAILMFLLRTFVLGLVLLYGPYLVLAEFSKFYVFAIFLDIINIFQFIFILNVIQKKCLFQFMLYVSVLSYALLFTSVMIVGTYKVNEVCEREDISMGFAFLCVYLCVLVIEMFTYIFIYNRLRKDSIWSNFKRIGVNPVINGKCNIVI